MQNLQGKAPQICRSAFTVILFLSFSFYLTSFSVPESYSGKHYSVGDDKKYTEIMEGPIIPARSLNDIRKHPIFPSISIPLYRLGLFLFSRLQFPENISMAFPFALTGLINLIISYYIFLSIFGNRNSGLFAKLLTILYGSCFSFWMFNSNVETYGITAVLQNSLILYLARKSITPQTKAGVFPTGVLLALAISGSLSMILMVFCIPLFYYYKSLDIKIAMKKSILTFFVSLVIIACVYAFYRSGYHAMNHHHQILFSLKSLLLFPIKYIAKYGDYTFRCIPDVFRSFFIYSISNIRLNNNIVTLCVFLLIFLMLLIISALKLKRERRRIPSIVKILLSFELFYVFFFCFFNPVEAILYTLPALLPFLVILFWGISELKNEALKFITVILFISAVILNNISIYSYLLELKEFRLDEYLCVKDRG